jgi:hypothetical protein
MAAKCATADTDTHKACTFVWPAPGKRAAVAERVRRTIEIELALVGELGGYVYHPYVWEHVHSRAQERALLREIAPFPGVYCRLDRRSWVAEPRWRSEPPHGGERSHVLATALRL